MKSGNIYSLRLLCVIVAKQVSELLINNNECVLLSAIYNEYTSQVLANADVFCQMFC